MSKRRKNGGRYFDRWYNHYRRQLYELALTTFEWENLPDSVSPRWLEKNLIDNGSVLLANNDTLGLVALQVTASGKLDETFTPTQYNVVAPNLTTSPMYDVTNSVLVYNNYMRNGSIPSIELFAQDLAEIKATIHVNIQAQKTPMVWQTDDKRKLSVLNTAGDIDQFEPRIVVNKDMNFKDIIVMPTITPYLADKLDTQREKIWNEAMTYIGIDNANHIDKKARVQSAEVEANDSQVDSMVLTMLKSRQEACKQANDLWGLNLKVVPRENKFKEMFEVEEDNNGNTND